MKSLKLGSRHLRYLELMTLRGTTISLKFGLNLFIARFLGLAELGVYGLIVGASQVIPVLMRGGFFKFLSRDMVGAPLEQTTRDVKHYLAWLGVGYLAMGALLPFVHLFESLRPFVPYLVFIWIIVFEEHLISDISVLLNNLHRPKASNVLVLSQAVAMSVPFAAIGLLKSELCNLELLLACWASGNAVVLVAVSSLFWKWPWASSDKLSWAWFKTRLNSSKYLFFSDFIGMVNQFSDRYILAAFVSLEVAGVYTLFFQISNAIFTLVNSSVTSSRWPAMMHAYRQKDFVGGVQRLRSMQKESALIYFVLSLVGAVVFYELAPYLNRPLIMDYMPLLWLLLAATMVKTWCMTSFADLYARHYDRELFGLNLVSFVMITSILFVSVPVYEVYAIPFAIMLIYGFMIYGISAIIRWRQAKTA